jgi:hypothetical protein
MRREGVAAMRPIEAWALRRLLTGRAVNGELQSLSGPFRGVAEHLAALPLVEARQSALDDFLSGRDDRNEVIRALAGIDPEGPPPEAESGPARFATLADIARIVAAQPWLWRGWLAAGVINAVAAEPGVGKTRFAMDLARRLWHAMPWPDGQPNELPEGTRTLWIQGDRNFAEMLQAARDFGLPDDAVALGSSPDDPTGGLDLDDPDTLAALAGRIEAARPALTIIDTVGMVTCRNICRPEEARAFFAPLMERAGESGIPFLALTHLNANKEALGRRIVEKARVVIKMTCPDPEGQPDRRRLWVDKSAVVKPPALGITMGESGNEYDFTPPHEPETAPRKPGPPPAKLDACKGWLSERLTPNPARVSEVRKDAEAKGYPSATLYRARDDIGVAEYQIDGRKWWKLPEAAAVQDVQDDDPP